VFDDRIKKYNSIIFDECHKIKDSKTQQSKFVEGLAHGKNFAFGLTGTPVVNKPKDLIHQLKVIGTLQLFGGYKTFTDRYCSGEREASNLKELNFMLNKHCFYRRSKQEVAKELPPKSRQIIQCDITTEREYKDAEANLTAYLRNYKDASDEKIQAAIRGKVMVQIGILKNISARGKIRDVIDYIDDVIENGEKIALFVHLKEVALIFKDHYHGSASITGSDDLQARQNSIRRFKEDPNCKIIVCSIKAAGIGIDGLQYASSTVAFIELPWHAADCDQCEDRLNRIGQERPVQSLFFLGRNTIDNHIFYDIIENKRGISDEVTGNTDKVEINFIDSIAKLYNIQ
jgi:SWI/SNF-related matrix-associated actin-dependent regulator 1 of chromatin subfamily A